MIFMKATHLFFLTILSLFCFNCYAQLNEIASINSENPALEVEMEENRKVLYYHVVEKINSRFGGSITSYNVSTLENVSKKDLGSNNTRTITPKYVKTDSKSKLAFNENKHPRVVLIPKITNESFVAKTEKENIGSNKNLNNNYSIENNLKSKPFVTIGKNNQSQTRIEDPKSNLSQAKSSKAILFDSSSSSDKLKSEFMNIEKIKSTTEVSETSAQTNPKFGSVNNKNKIAVKDNLIQNNLKTDIQQINTSKLSDILSSKIETLDKSIDFKNLKVIEKEKETERSIKFVTVDVIGAYERILEKGYVSKDLLKKVGNSYFFKGNLEMAAKRYSQLFEIETDLESIYYYRFSKSLLAIGQMDKAEVLSKKFYKLSLQNN